MGVPHFTACLGEERCDEGEGVFMLTPVIEEMGEPDFSCSDEREEII